ncbi:ABC transporter substrate-binding protein [Cardiobacteriaceae bacterium TAE3-ERU3]|nr:ABC transporter substrate-binding protein [Cardiobacteriaceae bacterium TAE3-ERU3]
MKHLMTSWHVTIAATLLAAMTPAQALDCSEGMRAYQHAAGETCIPEHPQRIAALDDLRLSLPLIELNAPLIASHGRISKVDGSQYIRAAENLTGATFANSGLAFLGNDPIDLEAIAQANPDLIITLVSRNVPVAKLEEIAPVVVFDEDNTDRFAIYQALADLTGTQARLDQLENRYAAQLAQLKRLVNSSDIRVSIIEGSDGEISIQHTYGSLGRVLRDAGFVLPEMVNNLAPGSAQKVSAEYLPQLDADVIFDTFRGDRNETPQDADQRMREVLENYCDVLEACKNGRYYRIPRDEAYAISYNALAQMTTMLQTIFSAPSLNQAD